MTLYITIIIYILSLIIGLFLMAVVKTISKGKFLLVASVHLFLLLIFIVAKTSSTATTTESASNYTFLFFICSGVMLAGLAWRSNILLPFKIYFSLFALTIVLFIFSPSRLMVFLLSGKYSDTLGKTFPVGENYFLEQQNTSPGLQHFKLICKHGMFHETIQRDIVFKGSLDSIRVLEFIPKEKVGDLLCEAEAIQNNWVSKGYKMINGVPIKYGTDIDGKKIVQGGERRKIVVGDVYHMAVKTPHWVIPDAGSSITYFVCNLYTD